MNDEELAQWMDEMASQSQEGSRAIQEMREFYRWSVIRIEHKIEELERRIEQLEQVVNN